MLNLWIDKILQIHISYAPFTTLFASFTKRISESYLTLVFLLTTSSIFSDNYHFCWSHTLK
jgi:hypothetical protein